MVHQAACSAQSLPLPGVYVQKPNSPSDSPCAPVSNTPSDLASHLASETSNLQLGEAGPPTDRASQLGRSDAQLGPTTPLASRFREEFGEAENHTASRKLPFWSKVQRTLP